MIKTCITNKDQLKKNKQMIFIQNFLCKEVSYYELHVAENQVGREVGKLYSFKKVYVCGGGGELQVCSGWRSSTWGCWR